ncbi:hypothetical protein B0T11DRAFT_74463 [Plectosphaerella cucumerina]|uniref:Uncharacterized protein n=1 Tax=Plectosphaerella cucumerina TaxID=40658 RepID=A0A8K0X2B4_9PEZI|nr:hypothetical protein B0T11DRAFT_74463 [Plectosphaerella cucumerina]
MVPSGIRWLRRKKSAGPNESLSITMSMELCFPRSHVPSTSLQIHARARPPPKLAELARVDITILTMYQLQYSALDRPACNVRPPSPPLHLPSVSCKCADGDDKLPPILTSSPSRLMHGRPPGHSPSRCPAPSPSGSSALHPACSCFPCRPRAPVSWSSDVRSHKLRLKETPTSFLPPVPQHNLQHLPTSSLLSSGHGPPCQTDIRRAKTRSTTLILPVPSARRLSGYLPKRASTSRLSLSGTCRRHLGVQSHGFSHAAGRDPEAADGERQVPPACTASSELLCRWSCRTRGDAMHSLT